MAPQITLIADDSGCGDAVFGQRGSETHTALKQAKSEPCEHKLVLPKQELSDLETDFLSLSLETARLAREHEELLAMENEFFKLQPHTSPPMLMRQLQMPSKLPCREEVHVKSSNRNEDYDPSAPKTNPAHEGKGMFALDSDYASLAAETARLAQEHRMLVAMENDFFEGIQTQVDFDTLSPLEKLYSKHAYSESCASTDVGSAPMSCDVSASQSEANSEDEDVPDIVRHKAPAGTKCEHKVPADTKTHRQSTSKASNSTRNLPMRRIITPASNKDFVYFHGASSLVGPHTRKNLHLREQPSGKCMLMHAFR
jgi:hypothetical protein